MGQSLVKVYHFIYLREEFRLVQLSFNDLRLPFVLVEDLRDPIEGE